MRLCVFERAPIGGSALTLETWPIMLARDYKSVDFIGFKYIEF